MTTWKDGGDYGILYREIVSEDGSRAICRVKVRQLPHHAKSIDRKEAVPYPQGEADLRLILQAPRMLKALREIAEGAIVSPDQSPGKIAESVLRVLRIAREAAAEYMIYAGAQQQRAEQAEEALKAILDRADDVMEIRSIANATIAAAAAVKER